MLKGKSLLDYKIFFPPNEYDENDKDIYLSNNSKRLRWKIYIALFVVSTLNFKNPKISLIFEKKHQFSLSFAVSVALKITKYLKKRKQLRYQKPLV